MAELGEYTMCFCSIASAEYVLCDGVNKVLNSTHPTLVTSLWSNAAFTQDGSDLITPSAPNNGTQFFIYVGPAE